MLPLLNLIKFRGVFQRNHSTLVDCNQIHVRNLFLFCFGLSVARQLFGENIICDSSGQSLPSFYVDTRCFIDGTVTIDQSKNLHLMHDYYQWVSIVLLLLAFSFYFPFRIWSRCYGSYLDELTTKVNDIETCKKIIRLVKNSKGNQMFWKMWALEIFYGVHLLFHIWLLDRFFNGALSTGGWSWNVIEIIFPISAKCIFAYYTTSGGQEAKYLCLLPLNSVYRRVFLVIYCVIIFLMVSHVFFFLYRVMLAIRLGREWINMWWSIRIASNAAQTWESKSFLITDWKTNIRKASQHDEEDKDMCILMKDQKGTLV